MALKSSKKIEVTLDNVHITLEKTTIIPEPRKPNKSDVMPKKSVKWASNLTGINTPPARIGRNLVNPPRELHYMKSTISSEMKRSSSKPVVKKAGDNPTRRGKSCCPKEIKVQKQGEFIPIVDNAKIGRKDKSENLDRAIEDLFRKSRDLSCQLRKAVLDHTSDSILETSLPLLVLIEAAKAGNKKEVENNAQKLVEADDELDPEDVEFDEHWSKFQASPHTGEHIVDEYPNISGITTAREAMRKMTEEDKERIAQQVESFRTEKFEFDREVAKWDDQGNDIIVIAKHMCMIMMEMMDFTRGRGPLKTTMDVINASKKISEAGTKLDKLARQIADQCPESSTKKDLLAYLQRIALYCHQLNITSKVKADVQNFSGELIVQGLDSATSLIQAAKNVMNAVVLTVKSSYVASTKYPRHGTMNEDTCSNPKKSLRTIFLNFKEDMQKQMNRLFGKK